MVNRRVNLFCIWVPGLIARVNHMAAGLIARVNHFYIWVHRVNRQVNLMVFGTLRVNRIVNRKCVISRGGFYRQFNCNF